MADILEFPTSKTKGGETVSRPTAAGRAEDFFSKRFLKKTEPTEDMARNFRIDAYLVDGGKEVAFIVTYPNGKVKAALVAAMLRRAALRLDPPN